MSSHKFDSELQEQFYLDLIKNNISKLNDLNIEFNELEIGQFLTEFNSDWSDYDLYEDGFDLYTYNYNEDSVPENMHYVRYSDLGIEQLKEFNNILEKELCKFVN